MHWLDLGVFLLYILVMLAIGLYFLRKNESEDDYYVSGRNMGSWHIGFSVVATDVGGGFSIGLGGLGFVMGMSGSWLLFTGLIGAWLSAVFLVPVVSRMSSKFRLLTFPQVFEKHYGKSVALLAGIVSAVGYLGFTSSQLLAGAKLASGSFDSLSLGSATLLMGAIAVVYTSMGGLKAVIYTDSVQWAILLFGLIFIGLPLGYSAVGGMDAILATIQPELLSFSNIDFKTILNWMVTIVPIWFVGMTLYQRIYACRDEKTAKKAWFIAGLLEWPLMAMMGVGLGLLGRVAAEQGMFASAGFLSAEGMDEEMGLPLLLKSILPVGLMGLMMSAYFSAILSTADSCLMAASGNVLTDILDRFRSGVRTMKSSLRLSQLITLLLGILAIFIAARMESVLDLMLYSYAFMVSGLFIPVIGMLFWRKSSSAGAFWSMLIGGFTTTYLIVSEHALPFGINLPDTLDANLYGMSLGLIVFIAVSLLFPRRKLPIESNKLEV